MSTPRSAPLLTFSLLCLACSAPQRKPTELIPLHVAIAPELEVFVSERRADPAHMADLRLAFDAARFTEQLGAALAESCFTRVTLLDTDAAAATEAAWVARGAEEDADLLLVCTLQYDPRVSQQMNGWFAAGLPFFLLGGPFCWLFPDRSYDADVQLRVRALDLAGDLEGSDAERLECFAETTALPELDLDFLDRAGDSYGYYALSVLIPSGLLASDHDGLEQDLPGYVTEKLLADLTQAVYRRRDDLVRNDARYAYFVDQDESGVRSLEGGGLELCWVVYYLRSESLPEPRAYRISAGEDGAWIDLTPERILGSGATSVDRYVRYEFHDPISPSLDARYVSLQVLAGDTLELQRRYTFAIPGREEVQP